MTSSHAGVFAASPQNKRQGAADGDLSDAPFLFKCQEPATASGTKKPARSENGGQQNKELYETAVGSAAAKNELKRPPPLGTEAFESQENEARGQVSTNAKTHACPKSSGVAVVVSRTGALKSDNYDACGAPVDCGSGRLGSYKDLCIEDILNTFLDELYSDSAAFAQEASKLAEQEMVITRAELGILEMSERECLLAKRISSKQWVASMDSIRSWMRR